MAIYIRMAFQYVEKDLLFQILLDSASHRHIFLSLVDPSHNPAILHTFEQERKNRRTNPQSPPSTTLSGLRARVD